jgi:hypothetical protein
VGHGIAGSQVQLQTATPRPERSEGIADTSVPLEDSGRGVTHVRSLRHVTVQWVGLLVVIVVVIIVLIVIVVEFVVVEVVEFVVVEVVELLVVVKVVVIVVEVIVIEVFVVEVVVIVVVFFFAFVRLVFIALVGRGSAEKVLPIVVLGPRAERGARKEPGFATEH